MEGVVKRSGLTKALILAAIFQLWYLLNVMDTLDRFDPGKSGC